MSRTCPCPALIGSFTYVKKNCTFRSKKFDQIRVTEYEKYEKLYLLGHLFFRLKSDTF
nr:MAG TPA: hypothetical protein [Caudoviricetes sp.]